MTKGLWTATTCESWGESSSRASRALGGMEPSHPFKGEKLSCRWWGEGRPGISEGPGAITTRLCYRFPFSKQDWDCVAMSALPRYGLQQVYTN